MRAKAGNGQILRASCIEAASHAMRTGQCHTPFRMQLFRGEAKASMHKTQGVALALWPCWGSMWHVTTTPSVFWLRLNIIWLSFQSSQIADVRRELSLRQSRSYSILVDLGSGASIFVGLWTHTLLWQVDQSSVLGRCRSQNLLSLWSAGLSPRWLWGHHHCDSFEVFAHWDCSTW